MLSSSVRAQEASIAGARGALTRAEQLQKGLDGSDPFDMKDSLAEALRLVPVMESMMALLKSSAQKIALIRDEVEKKAENGPKKDAAFYQSDLKIMKEREADFEDHRVKFEAMLKTLRGKIEKARSNPEVQELLKNEEAVRRANETLEKIRALKLPPVGP